MLVNCDEKGNITITFNARDGAAKTKPSKSGKVDMVDTTGGAIAIRVPGVDRLVKVAANAYMSKD